MHRWLMCSCSRDHPCTEAGTMILLPHIRIPSTIPISSPNSQYRSAWPSILVDRLPFITYLVSAFSQLSVKHFFCLHTLWEYVQGSIALMLIFIPAISVFLFIIICLNNQSVLYCCGPHLYRILILVPT